MRRPLVAGNWKMNGSRASAEALATAIARAAPRAADVLVCPPAPYLELVGRALSGASVALGAQDCSAHEPGARTGEIAAAMLVDSGCSHVIVGHSERRAYCGESDDEVVAKAAAAHAAGLVPVLCVGETIEERRAGETEAVIERQLAPLLAHGDAAALLDAVVIAYEPVWAIGTGESATPSEAAAVHQWLRQHIAARDRAAGERMRILYGGSVKPGNAAELFAMPDIDGGLIGGASLDAEAFLAIIAAAA